MNSPKNALPAIFLCTLIAARAADQPAAELQRWLDAGKANYTRGDYEAARLAFEKAWQAAQETPAADPVRYEILKRLSATRAAAGQWSEAESHLQEAITWRENTFGVNDPKIIDDFLEVAALCRAMHDYDRALVVLQRVVSMHARTAGFESLEVAGDLSRMAQIHMDQKNHDNASGSLMAALNIRTKLSGADHPSLLPDLDRLGEVRIVLRQYDRAEETFRRALVIRERTVGKESADLITTIDGLAYACFGQKKYDEAEPIYQRLVGLWQSSAGKEHPMVAMALDKLAVFYRDQKKMEQAKAAADHANAVRAHFLARGLGQEAAEQLAEGSKDEAIRLYRRALATLEPPHAVTGELRAEMETFLKNLETPEPKPVPRTKKAAPRKK